MHWEARMTTGDEVKSADQVSAILEQAYYELATEARLARVGLKERQETAPIVERYRALYTRPQIAAIRAEIEASGVRPQAPEDGPLKPVARRLTPGLGGRRPSPPRLPRAL